MDFIETLEIISDTLQEINKKVDRWQKRNKEEHKEIIEKISALDKHQQGQIDKLNDEMSDRLKVMRNEN